MKHQFFYSLRQLIYVFNSVVNTKLPAILSHRCSTTVSLETYPFITTRTSCLTGVAVASRKKLTTKFAGKVFNLVTQLLKIKIVNHMQYDYLLQFLKFFSVQFQLIVFFSCRDYLALNVYVALCYYKLDYYDVSQVIVLCLFKLSSLCLLIYYWI